MYIMKILYLSAVLTRHPICKMHIIIIVLIMKFALKFLSSTNARLYYTYKMLKCTVKISHDCSYKVRHRLPDDGPGGPKRIVTIMRYFNCTF
jgi:hypothetical protein